MPHTDQTRRPHDVPGLTILNLYDKLSDMRTNVSTLLREFPKVRRAALAGETVVIETREGNLILTAEVTEAEPVYGSMRDRILRSADDLDRPTLTDDQWVPAL